MKELSYEIPDEKDAIEEKRKAYGQALEGYDGGLTGKVKQLVSAIRGGKLGVQGELLMEIDAEREDKIRDAVKHGADPALLDAYQKSYLTLSEEDASGFYRAYNAERIAGIINGCDVNILHVEHVLDTHRYKGTIDGEKILEKDAREIFRTYQKVAHMQIKDIADYRTDEQREKETQNAQRDKEKTERMKSIARKLDQ